MPLFVLAVIELIGATLLLTACLRLPSATAFGLAAFVVASAVVIGLTEALSLVALVTPAGYLVGETALLAGAAALWIRRARPRPMLPRVGLPALRRHPVLVFLLAVVAGALAYELFLVVATPPNNWDSMTYHLSRAAAWYQRHQVTYIADVHTQRQNAFQPNGEIEILYTFAFLGRDLLASVPQFLAELAVLGSVFGIARRVGAGRAGALFAALLTATLTQVALQSVTTQNDLLAASFVSVAAYFALGRLPAETALAGVGVGLALGTKGTSAFALPVLLLLAALTIGRRRLVGATVCAVLGFAAFGFYGYGLNLVNTGKILGDPSAEGGFRPQLTTTGTVSTAARLTYRFADLPGFQTPAGWLGSLGTAGQDIFDALSIPANPPQSTRTPFVFTPNPYSDEAISFFGPLGLLLVLPLAGFYLVTWDPRRAWAARGALALAIPVTIVAIALTYRYNVWLGRFLIGAVALTMPLAATLYRRQLVAGGLALVGALTLGLTHAYNYGKPTGLDGRPPVWSQPRSDAQAVQQPWLAGSVAGVERDVPSDATLGVVFGIDDWDYPLYGPDLTRRLVYLPAGPTGLALAGRRGIRWIVYGEGQQTPDSVPGWRLLETFGPSGWSLVERSV